MHKQIGLKRKLPAIERPVVEFAQNYAMGNFRGDGIQLYIALQRSTGAPQGFTFVLRGQPLLKFDLERHHIAQEHPGVSGKRPNVARYVTVLLNAIDEEIGKARDPGVRERLRRIVESPGLRKAVRLLGEGRCGLS